MWKLLLAGQALVALTLPAMAADVAPYFSPPPVPEWNWTGFYVGANTGWVGSVSNDVTNTGTDTGIHGLGSALVHGKIPSSVALTESGFIGGAQFGYNWQVGSVWVWGAEVDVDGVNAKSSATAAFPGGGGAVPFATVYNRQLDTLGTLRGRWGFLQPPGLLWFATGGLAYGETKIGFRLHLRDLRAARRHTARHCHSVFRDFLRLDARCRPRVEFCSLLEREGGIPVRRSRQSAQHDHIQLQPSLGSLEHPDEHRHRHARRRARRHQLPIRQLLLSIVGAAGEVAASRPSFLDATRLGIAAASRTRPTPARKQRTAQGCSLCAMRVAPTLCARPKPTA